MRGDDDEGCREGYSIVPGRLKIWKEMCNARVWEEGDVRSGNEDGICKRE